MKKIAIIGAGNVGLALAQGWKKAGHQIVFGVRDSSSVKIQKATDTNTDIGIYSISEAVQISDIIVISTPANAVLDIAAKIGNMRNKIIIDATNSVRNNPAPYETGFHALLALTNTTDIVKCFNSTGFENMVNPLYGDIAADMFMAGDSKIAKTAARELAQDLGFEQTYDFGGNDKVKLLEQFAMAWINLAIMQGNGRNMIFKIIKR